MNEPTIFGVDIESTGLNSEIHEIWEVGMYLRKPGEPEEAYHWFLPVRLHTAEPIALNIGRYHERFGGVREYAPAFATSFARLTWGAYMVGANPAFDADFLSRLLKKNGQCPGWHHRLIDVQAMALGYLPQNVTHSKVPMSLAKVANLLGVELKADEAHTALADARAALDCYSAMTGGK